MLKIGIVFPGQASQYPGMGKRFYDQYPVVRELFEKAEATLQMDMKKLCFESSMEVLTDTRNTQIATFLVSVAMYQVLREQYGIQPVVMAGHSLGEITALVCSEAICFEEGLKLIQKRGDLMHGISCDGLGSMMSVSGVSYKEVELFLELFSEAFPTVAVSCFNGSKQTVLSGSVSDLERFKKDFEEFGAKNVLLNVSAPFHNPLMASMVPEFEGALETLTYSALRIPVVSNVDGALYTDHTEIKQSLKAQIVSPVNWIGTMECFAQMDLDAIIEVGPKAVLTRLCTDAFGKDMCLAMDQKEDEIMVRGLLSPTMEAQYENNYHKAYLKECVKISLCSENHSGSSNQQNLRQLTERLKGMLKETELETLPSVDQFYENSYQLMTEIMTLKELPLTEVRWRLKRLLPKTVHQATREKMTAHLDGRTAC